MGVCRHAIERRKRRSEETNMRDDAGRAWVWVWVWVLVKGVEQAEGAEGEKRSGGRGRTWWRMRREDEGGKGGVASRGGTVEVRVRVRKEGTRLYNNGDDRTS
jgi:hypothetical protein